MCTPHGFFSWFFRCDGVHDTWQNCFPTRAKRQEHADNFRNMQTSNARRNKSPKLRSRICKLQNAISCNKRPSSNTGAAVLAPLGAFGSAAPVSQSGVPRRVKYFCRLLHASKASRQPPPYAPTPRQNTGKNACCRPSGPKLQIFCRLFADPKFIKNQTP